MIDKLWEELKKQKFRETGKGEKIKNHIKNALNGNKKKTFLDQFQVLKPTMSRVWRYQTWH